MQTNDERSRPYFAAAAKCFGELRRRRGRHGWTTDDGPSLGLALDVLAPEALGTPTAELDHNPFTNLLLAARHAEALVRGGDPRGRLAYLWLSRAHPSAHLRLSAARCALEIDDLDMASTNLLRYFEHSREHWIDPELERRRLELVRSLRDRSPGHATTLCDLERLVLSEQLRAAVPTAPDDRGAVALDLCREHLLAAEAAAAAGDAPAEREQRRRAIELLDDDALDRVDQREVLAAAVHLLAPMALHPSAGEEGLQEALDALRPGGTAGQAARLFAAAARLGDARSELDVLFARAELDRATDALAGIEGPVPRARLDAVVAALPAAGRRGATALTEDVAALDRSGRLRGAGAHPEWALSRLVHDLRSGGPVSDATIAAAVRAALREGVALRDDDGAGLTLAHALSTRVRAGEDRRTEDLVRLLCHGSGARNAARIEHMLLRTIASEGTDEERRSVAAEQAAQVQLDLALADPHRHLAGLRSAVVEASAQEGMIARAEDLAATLRRFGDEPPGSPDRLRSLLLVTSTILQAAAPGDEGTEVLRATVAEATVRAASLSPWQASAVIEALISTGDLDGAARVAAEPSVRDLSTGTSAAIDLVAAFRDGDERPVAIGSLAALGRGHGIDRAAARRIIETALTTVLDPLVVAEQPGVRQSLDPPERATTSGFDALAAAVLSDVPLLDDGFDAGLEAEGARRAGTSELSHDDVPPSEPGFDAPSREDDGTPPDLGDPCL